MIGNITYDTYAIDNNEISGIKTLESEEELKIEIKSLLKKYGYTVQEESMINENNIDIKFDTIKELENFLEESNKNYEENSEIIEQISNNSNEREIKSHHFKKDSKQWTAFYKRNLIMKYEAKRVNGYRQFVRVFDRKAYPTGITIGEWKVHSGGYTQTYSKKHHPRDTVTNKVKGQWKATVSVAGVPVGFTQDQTWTFILWIA